MLYTYIYIFLFYLIYLWILIRLLYAHSQFDTIFKYLIFKFDYFGHKSILSSSIKKTIKLFSLLHTFPALNIFGSSANYLFNLNVNENNSNNRLLLYVCMWSSVLFTRGESAIYRVAFSLFIVNVKLHIIKVLSFTDGEIKNGNHDHLRLLADDCDGTRGYQM